MTFVSTTLEHTDRWEDICFPVESVKLSSLLPEGYQLVASDRQMAIVGETAVGSRDIFALQSQEYSLIPNQFIRSVIDACVKDYSLDARYTSQGEFSINIILPKKISMGSESLNKSLIINNSYNGKTPFTIQGTAIKLWREKKVRVSYYRTICSNGLIGWVDDFMTMEDYLQWLMAGKPKRHADMVQTSITVEEKVYQEKQELNKKFSHKSLKIDLFQEYLTKELKNFLDQPDSLTTQVYRRLANNVFSKDLHTVIVKTGLPKMLARQALERLRKEEKLLAVKPNLWLIYNAINYALFNSRSSLTINDRYRLDEFALHHLTAQTI